MRAFLRFLSENFDFDSRAIISVNLGCRHVPGDGGGTAVSDCLAPAVEGGVFVGVEVMRAVFGRAVDMMLVEGAVGRQRGGNE